MQSDKAPSIDKKSSWFNLRFIVQFLKLINLFANQVESDLWNLSTFSFLCLFSNLAGLPSHPFLFV